jgi:gliding motility-associated-like protein
MIKNYFLRVKNSKRALVHEVSQWILFYVLLLFALLPGRVFSQSQDIFTANGTWVVPNCVATITVEVWGGGAGGTAGIAGALGSGGGGGGYSSSVISVTPGNTYSITVGAGGASGGGNGGSSWFGSATTVQANGGNGANGGALGVGTIVIKGSNNNGGTGGSAGGTGGGAGGVAGTSGSGPGGGGGAASGLGASGAPGAPGQVTISYSFLQQVTVDNYAPFLCPGNSVTITASQAGSYTWSPGGATTAAITVSPAATTTYSVLGTSPGCNSVAIVNVTVYLPYITVNSLKICQEDIGTLTCSPAISYIWAPGGQTTASIKVSPNSTTTYTVTGSACGNTSSAIATVTVDCPPVPCTNANFSTCDFTGWTGTYCASGGYPNPFKTLGMRIGSLNAASTSSPETNHVIMSSGFDPILGGTTLPVVDPLGSGCSGRLGNSQANGGGESMMYKYLVKPSSTAFTYNYAVVVSDGGHPACAQPYFKIRMWAYNSPTDSVPIPCAVYDVDATQAASIAGFTKITSGGSTLYYKTWTSVTIPVTPYVGQMVSVQFITRDCCPNCTTTGNPNAADGGCTGSSGGSHFAYAYVDAICSPSAIIPTLACAGNATLTAPTGSATYSWAGPGIVSGGNTNIAVVNATGTYTVNMKTFGVQPCPYSLTYNLTVLNGVSLSVNTATICAGETAILAASSNASSYLWAPGGQTAATIYVSPTSTTSYSVTGFSAGGCSNTQVGVVTVNPKPAVTVNSTTVCAGVATTTVTAAGANSYSWSTGATTSAIAVNPPATTSYTVVGTSLGCIDTAVGTVGIVIAPIVTVSSVTICAGQTTTLTASGAPAGYNWSTGTTANPITVAPTTTTTYSVTGIGCPNTGTGVVTVNSIPTVIASSATVCSGATATLTAGGANSYSWSNGATTTSITDSPYPTTTYTVTGNSLGCINTATATITTVTAPVVSINTATVCAGATATLTAVGADSYTWSNGATTATITVSPSITMSYSVTGLQFGYTCPGVATTTVTVNPLPVVSVTSDTICNGQGGPGTITASGANSYLWSTGGTTNSITYTPSTTTTYTVTGNSLGCTGANTGTITVNPIPVVTSDSFTICTGQSATLTAAGAASYKWSTGATTVTMIDSPTVTTTYTVTGNSLGCISMGTGVITVNPIPNVSATSATVCNGVSATLTAIGANSFSWSTGSTVASMSDSPTVTTTYTVTGTSLGCTSTATGVILVNPIPTVSFGSKTICKGDVATLTANGAITYSWSNGATNKSITVSPPASQTYSVTGNSLGCTGVANGTVTVNPIPTVSVTSTTICRGAIDSLTASGADTYLWSNGATTVSIQESPVASTIYSVKGTSLHCSQTSSGTIHVLSAPSVVVVPQSICVGQTSYLYAYGAPAYTWSDGSTANPLIVTPAVTTTYSLTGLGCPNTASGTVTVFPLPEISIASSPTVCAGVTATLTAVDVNASGSNNQIHISTYSWSTGSDSIAIVDAPRDSTVYTVVGATAFGCKDTAVGTIVVKPNPVITVTSALVCPGGAATLKASGADFYVWSNGATTNSISASPASTTTYSVKGTTTWTCKGTGSGVIAIGKFPQAGFVASPNPTDIFNTEIHFTNQSSVDVVYWHWDYGDGDTLAPSTASPIHKFPEEVANYKVTLIVHNATPCWDTISGEILIGPEFTFFIPNSFTPNRDKHDNGFRGTGVGIVNYQLQIFDRWGNLIWQSHNLDEYWNGKANGGSDYIQEDVYVWKVFLTDVFGRQHHYLGTVTAIK